MNQITVTIGRVVSIGSSSRQQDDTREVQFEGEQLAIHTDYGSNPRSGRPTDTIGVTRTLYRAQDGRYLVYIEDWSHWVGSTNTYQLVEVKQADLGPTGPYALLGQEAGLSRPLTLDEALT